MAGKRQASGPRKTVRSPEYDDPAAVAAHLAGLPQPVKLLVAAIRDAIVAADPRVTEGIKWNSASFYCRGWFATIRDNAKTGVQVIFHHGAKVRADATLRQSISDPGGLLVWPSTDRAIVSFASPVDFSQQRVAFVGLVVQWVAYQVQAADAEADAGTDGEA